MEYRRLGKFPVWCGPQTLASVIIAILCFTIIPIIMRREIAEMHHVNKTSTANHTQSTNTTLNDTIYHDIWINATFNDTWTGTIFDDNINTGIKHREKRGTSNSTSDGLISWMDHPNPPHPYATNMWWRLINHTVRMYASRNCYVCAQFPHSTTGGDWWPHQDRNTSLEMTIIAVAAAAIQKTTKDNATAGFMLNGTWKNICLSKRVFGQVATVKHIPANLICYERTKGTRNLGRMPGGRCSTVYKDTEKNFKIQQKCMNCLRLSNYVHPPAHLTNTTLKPQPQPTIAYQYLVTSNRGRGRCPKCSTVHVPDQEGTGVIEGHYWLCGYQVYLSLPRNWTGVCALVQLHGGAIILPHQTSNTQRRMKRGLFNFLTESPVPKNHHIWSIAEKLLVAFSPATGVISLMHEVEITRYELTSFINTTRIMMEGIREELRGLRLTALQNRMVLDQLTAAQGGVCAMIGETCCTYIPDNDADGHLIEEGIQNITLMTRVLAKSESGSNFLNLDWFENILPSMKNIMLLTVCILTPVLLLLCLWPCLMKLVKKVLSHTTPHQMIVYSISQENYNDRIYENV